MAKSQAARDAARARRDRRRAKEEFGQAALAQMKKRQRNKPDIVQAAVAAAEGNPHKNDPWNFNSVLENQKGTPQAERFIEIIKRTRRSALVADNDAVHAVWDLCSLPWERDLSSWKPKGKKAETKFWSLAGHLTCKYPMPRFLFSVFFVQDTVQGHGHRIARRNRNQAIHLFEYLAKGGSVRKAVQEGHLPVPLSKKMCHAFMQSTVDKDLYQSVRYAQVLGSGGEDRLAAAIAGTTLGRGFYPPAQEERYLAVIEWFCRQAMLNPDTVGPLFDFIQHRMALDGNYTMAGRTVAAVERGMQEWHAQMNHHPGAAGVRNRWRPEPLPSKFEESGFTEGYMEQGHAIWTVTELLTPNALNSEGAAMRHCVSSYGYKVASGATSIWSLQRDGSRQITIEVDNGIRSVVQARGKCNMKPNPEQLRFLTEWAQDNRLRIRST